MVNGDNLQHCTFYLAEAPIHNHEHCVQVQYSQSDIIMDNMNFVNSYSVAVVNNILGGMLADVVDLCSQLT